VGYSILQNMSRYLFSVQVCSWTLTRNPEISGLEVDYVSLNVSAESFDRYVLSGFFSIIIG
jgi:hypothetical protein